jgi:LacI family transcriptional regulator
VNKRPTRSDVARLARVSVATVSYVVNNGPRSVSQETRERVLAAIDELGYRPHAIARSLKTGNTQTVALVVQSLLSSFPGYLVNAVEESLAHLNYGLILASSHEDPERERRMLNVLADQSIDGLLCVPVSNRDGRHVTALMEEGIPVVFIDRHIPGVKADVVMSDNVAAARRITSHLIEQGCRRILCLPFSNEASSALDRVEGYRQALCDHGLPVDENLILVAPYTLGAETEQTLLDHFDTYGLPDGIFCTTDDLIIDSIKTLKQRGIRVPDQVKVGGGFVYAGWNALLESPLPIVHQDFELMAQRAVELLLERIQGNDSPPRTELIEAKFFLEN